VDADSEYIFCSHKFFYCVCNSFQFVFAKYYIYIACLCVLLIILVFLVTFDMYKYNLLCFETVEKGHALKITKPGFFKLVFSCFFLGKGDEWARARTMQQKMGRTRSHVESRILEITEILAPPLGRSYRQRRIQDPGDH
jgi:hypothetical protein